MELGQKLRQARLELGLSQRQLCGDTITRNMLSLIENGSATPSVDTLRFLAERLGKPVSFFLEEQTVTSPNQPLLEQARPAFDRGDYAEAVRLLADYRSPDPVFDREAALLQALSLIALAEDAISREKYPYALELLERAKAAGEKTSYYTPELERRRLLSLARLTVVELPTDDRELLLRSEAALKQGDHCRAAQYLDAAQNRSDPAWNYLRGQAYLSNREYARAQTCFEAAWDHAPKACAAFLEQCCREQEDFKGAYHYACRLRELE